MDNLYIGIGFVSFLLRHARSLKDRRQVTQSLQKRLKNLGFSVTQDSGNSDRRFISLGYSYVADSHEAVANALQRVPELFIGYEVVRADKEILSYADLPSSDEFTEFSEREPD